MGMENSRKQVPAVARLYLDGTMQMWIDAEESLELWQIILESKKAPNDL